MAVAVQPRRQNGFILGMARSIHFFLSVVSLVSILLLIVGFVVSMSNVMTGGAIVDSAMMKRAWAIATSSAIEANIPLMFFSAWASWRDEKNLEGLCSILLGLALAIITGISVGIESLQQSLVGQTIESATVKMHIDMATFIYCRVALIILLVAREGYHLFTILEDASGEENTQILPEEKPFFMVVWIRGIGNFFAGLWRAIFSPKKQENPAQNTQNVASTNQQLLPEKSEEKERKTDPSLVVPQAKITRPLVQEVGEKPAEFPKNFYTRREAADLAKVRVLDIDSALTSGELLCSKDDREKILKSSLKPFVEKQKSTRGKREKLRVVNGS